MPIDRGAARPSRRVLMISGIAALCVAAVVVVTGLMTRAHETSEGKTWTAFGGGIPALQVNVVTL